MLRKKSILFLPNDSVDYNGNFSNYTEIVSINALGVDNNITLTGYKLYQDCPNPFNPVTTISYDIIKDSYVKLFNYNSASKLVNVLAAGYKATGEKVNYLEWH